MCVHSAWFYNIRSDAVYLYSVVKIRARQWEIVRHGICYMLQTSAYNGSTCGNVCGSGSTCISDAVGSAYPSGAGILRDDIPGGACDEKIYASSGEWKQRRGYMVL